MPKNGSSRSKRRARRLASQQNLRYTEALRRSSSGDRRSEPGHDDEASTEVRLTALEALHATAERVTATDPADTAAALQTVFHALTLTSTANGLIHEALLEADFEVYWPGESFLDGDRRQHLAVAVDRLGSALPTLTESSRHDQVRILTPLDSAPQEYEPVAYHDVVYPPDATDKARQLLLSRTRSVALANKEVWERVRVLLGRVLGRVRDPQQRRACRIANLVLEEILHPVSGSARRDLDRRVLAITEGPRSAAELVADEHLMRALHESVAATAQANGWSPMSAVSAALERADLHWRPEHWGYTSTIKLIAATKQFSIRHVPRKGHQVIEIRGRAARISIGR